MKTPLHLWFLPALCVLVLGCTGGRNDDTGWWFEDPEDPEREASEFFEPDAFFVETYAAYGGDRLDEFRLDPNDPASALPPVMMITFAENRYFSTGNEDYTCSWFGVMNVEGIDLLEDDALWLGYAISLDFLETTCFDMDPWVWGESTPTRMLETAFLGIGYRPMSREFESVIRPQVSSSGFFWDSDWAPYVFSMVFGLWDEDTGQLVGSEIDYAFAYQMEDGVLSYDFSGNPVPLRLSEYDGAPEGLLAGYPYYDEEPAALR